MVYFSLRNNQNIRFTSYLLVFSGFSTSKRFYSRATVPSLPPCDFIPKEYCGPSYKNLRSLRKNRINPAVFTYYNTPMAVHQGHKQWLFDINGRRYLDMFGGICTVSVGHCHPEITKTLTEESSTLNHISNLYLHPNIHEYAFKLTEKFPGDLKVAYFVNSGSEANDLAILMARAYTNNHEVISLRGCYHGMTSQTMTLTSTSHYRFPIAQSASFHHAMCPDVYKGLWGGKHCRDSPAQTDRECSCTPTECKANERYLEQLEEVYRYSIPKGHAAAFFAESMQGVGGVVQFPKDYLKKAYEMIKSYGGLFIADEVQTGFGRTGDHFWGFQMHGITPDIVTMAKGIGNGFPLGAVVTTPEIAQALTKSLHFNTFGGNALATAVGITVLDIIEKEKLQENSKAVGTYLINKLVDLKKQLPIIGDVRGKGLMVGVELVAGDGSTAPLATAKLTWFWERCRELGLLIGSGGYDINVVRLAPPMCVTKNDADFVVSVIKLALEEISQKS